MSDPEPVIHDRRRIDPETGEVRQAAAEQPAGPTGAAADEPTSGDSAPDQPVAAAQPTALDPTAELRELVDERTADLQRLQAEYANYKKRVDRDRALARQAGIEAVVRDLLPVLDAIEAAREHGELEGGFKLVADELQKVSGKFGLSSFGVVGEAFDPKLHEALMQMPYEGDVTEPTVSAVMQKGVTLHDRVLRPARVAVANPEETTADDATKES